MDGKIQTYLYRKKIDKVQYLLPFSCHPFHIFDNIPYSLALRIVRICSVESEREMRMEELEEMLKSKNCNGNIVRAARGVAWSSGQR